MHSDAPTAAATDWRQILALYDQLLALAPSPVVALNRAVAVAEVDGPGGGARARRRARPAGYHLLPRRSAPTCSAGWAATRRPRALYEAAIARTENAAERDFLSAGSHETLGKLLAGHGEAAPISPNMSISASHERLVSPLGRRRRR